MSEHGHRSDGDEEREGHGDPHFQDGAERDPHRAHDGCDENNGGCGGNAAPYLLGALTDGEAEVFLAHVDCCAICRDELAALRPVTVALPAAVPQLSAPSAVKRRVMSTVRADARRRRSDAAPARRSSSPWRAPRPRAAVLAGAVVAVLAVAAVLLALPLGGNGGSTRTIRAAVAMPNVNAVVRVSEGHAELAVTHMPQAPANHVYEVWLERGGTPRPTDALFTVTSGGDATVAVPGSLHGVSEILVTPEPRGGSSVPTHAPVITARLS
jgi:anti-sigma-K factor RskA